MSNKYTNFLYLVMWEFKMKFLFVMTYSQNSMFRPTRILSGIHVKTESGKSYNAKKNFTLQ